MESQRKESEKRKMQVLRALNCMPDIDEAKVLAIARDPEKLEREMDEKMKKHALTAKLEVALSRVDPEKAVAELKARPKPAAKPLRTRKTIPAEPSRRSERKSNQPARYTYEDLYDEDEENEDPKRRRNRRKADEDGEWSGKQRSSQLSRGELKPYVKRENSYGPIDDIPNGMWWSTRMECSRDGIHRPPVSGIHGGPKGAYSVALSGGYAENVDSGEEFWFTGEGGRELRGTKANPKNLRTAPQTKDQTWTAGNMALYRSIVSKNPVRVIRGFSKNKNFTSEWAPVDGYRYDGLYEVIDWKVDNGLTGFNIFKFHFKRLPGQDPIKRD